MWAFFLMGCLDTVDAGKLAGTTVTEAWIDDFTWMSLTVLGGGLTGSGTLKARLESDEVVRQPIEFGGAVGGFGVVMMAGGAERVDYVLPAPKVGGELLFGSFDGSLETIVAGAGYQSLHLRSPEAVQLDSEGIGALVGIGVFAVQIDLYAVERAGAGVGSEEQGPADSGDDSGED
jgi:hypothetical protein